MNQMSRDGLALMAPPSIAAVFDGGTTTEGRPYFVMEYVKGEPITTYCDRHLLGMRDRWQATAARPTAPRGMLRRAW